MSDPIPQDYSKSIAWVGQECSELSKLFSSTEASTINKTVDHIAGFVTDCAAAAIYSCKSDQSAAIQLTENVSAHITALLNHFNGIKQAKASDEDFKKNSLPQLENNFSKLSDAQNSLVTLRRLMKNPQEQVFDASNPAPEILKSAATEAIGNFKSFEENGYKELVGSSSELEAHQIEEFKFAKSFAEGILKPSLASVDTSQQRQKQKEVSNLTENSEVVDEEVLKEQTKVNLNTVVDILEARDGLSALSEQAKEVSKKILSDINVTK